MIHSVYSRFSNIYLYSIAKQKRYARKNRAVGYGGSIEISFRRQRPEKTFDLVLRKWRALASCEPVQTLMHARRSACLLSRKLLP